MAVEGYGAETVPCSLDVQLLPCVQADVAFLRLASSLRMLGDDHREASVPSGIAGPHDTGNFGISADWKLRFSGVNPEPASTKESQQFSSPVNQ